MSNQMLLGLSEIASFLHCSDRKLHDPKIKQGMSGKGVIFKRNIGRMGRIYWLAFTDDLINFQKERAVKGKPF